MARIPKGEEIKVRVTADTKRRVLQLAEARGETESVIVREALMQYLGKTSLPITVQRDVADDSGGIPLHSETADSMLAQEKARRADLNRSDSRSSA